ncbi:MAG TPA: 2-amino-4-hydroxy-6-hydroxymethyldihydropteridine pyrophosphokinase, partial [Hydrogenobaculum sp.]|nr:2-amino-4-hydroxy-6-hydroxymethyldihydropteridine pyrophosphokinase [Hydrogenobaculum sp.]
LKDINTKPINRLEFFSGLYI